MAGATLRKIIRDNNPAASEDVPYWMELAMAQAFEQSARFGVAAESAQISADNPPEGALDIFKYSPEEKIAENIKQSHSYWTLVSIAKAADDKDELAVFMNASLAENSADKALSRTELLNRSKSGFDLWWRCLITGEIWARLGGVLSPKRSDEDIVRLAVLQVDSAGDKRVGLSDGDVWKYRQYIGKDLELRLLEIKVTLAKINPIYYNCLVSLGEMYEAACEDESAAFDSSKEKFISEFKNARLLSDKAREMLSKKQ